METPTEVKVPEVNPLAEQFQRVAKQEKHLQEERKKIDEARRSFEAEKNDADIYRSLKSKDPFEILNHFGLDYDKLTKLAIDKSKPGDPIARKALEAVERLQNELKEKDSQVHKEKIGRAEMQLMNDINTTIKSGEFDVIEKLDAVGTVREYLEEMYAQTGEIPDIKEACQAVTNHIVGLYQKISDSKWIKPKDIPEKIEEILQPKAESISNKMSQTSATLSKPMTESDRMNAAIKAMEMVKGSGKLRL